MLEKIFLAIFITLSLYLIVQVKPSNRVVVLEASSHFAVVG